ncbi:hypothetical protein Sjap_004553 [Stephania japonica]|uniref:Uncharacterized protein n=1 Tax=Stephania japonica TaxID=461633 RepID=A0AAP0K3G2_9MAGN
MTSRGVWDRLGTRQHESGCRKIPEYSSGVNATKDVVKLVSHDVQTREGGNVHALSDASREFTHDAIMTSGTGFTPRGTSWSIKPYDVDRDIQSRGFGNGHALSDVVEGNTPWRKSRRPRQSVSEVTLYVTP